MVTNKIPNENVEELFVVLVSVESNIFGLFTVQIISTVLGVFVRVFFSVRFHAIIVVHGFTMKVDMADDLNISFVEVDSMQEINHSHIGPLFCAISGQSFWMVILIVGFEKRATLSHQLLNDILVILRSKVAFDMLKNASHMIIVENVFVKLRIIYFLF